MSDPTPILVRGATVVDGTGAAARPDTSVLIADGRIRAVGPAAAMSEAPGARTIDGGGMTVLPGLMELHSHSLFPSEMPAFIKNGITTMRFAGVEPEPVVELRRRAAAGELVAPRIYTCGQMFEPSPPQFPEWTLAVDSPDEAEAAARRLMALEGLERVDALIAEHRTTPDILRPMVAVAHEHGRPVVGQLDYTDGLQAAEIGIDQLDNTSRIFASREYPAERLARYTTRAGRLPLHLAAWASIDWDLTAPIMEAMRRHDVVYCPTLVVYESLAGVLGGVLENDRDWEEYGAEERSAHFDHWAHIQSTLTDEHRGNAARAIANITEWLSRYHRMGGRLVPGTDLAFGAIFLHRELGHLASAGLSVNEVIHAATGVAAAALGCPGELGTVEPGKLADLIVVPGDGVADLAVLREPRYVFRAGELVGGADRLQVGASSPGGS